MADIECFGRVTVNWRAAGIVLVDVEMALGREKSLEVLREGAVMVLSSARGDGVIP